MIAQTAVVPIAAVEAVIKMTSEITLSEALVNESIKTFKFTMTDRQAGEISAKLKDAGIRFKISADQRSIQVDTSSVTDENSDVFASVIDKYSVNGAVLDGDK